MAKKIRPMICPNCTSGRVTVWKNAYPRSMKYFVECDKCHWCGKTKLLKFRAIRAWNKER